MIFYLIMCQILLSHLRLTNSHLDEDQTINKRCSQGDYYESRLVRLNRNTSEYSNRRNSPPPINTVDTWYYQISKNLSGQHLDTKDVATPILLSSNDKIFERETATEKLTNIDIDSTDSETEPTNVKLEDENDASFCESYRICTTTKRPRYNCIEKPPLNRQINLKFPDTEYAFRKVKQKCDEITVIPITRAYIAQAVDLVFPLKGEPPPQYRCFEIKKNNGSDSKTIKIYKLVSPRPVIRIPNKARSNKTSIRKDKVQTTIPSFKVKRQGYWMELQMPLSTEIYSKQQLSKSKVMNIFKPKVNKCKKHKTKKTKKKKSFRVHESTETTTNEVLCTTELQTEPPPHDLEPDKCAIMSNETQKFDLMNKDQEKIFIKSKDFDHNMTVDSSPHLSKESSLNATDQPRSEQSHNHDALSPNPSDKEKDSIKPQKDDKVWDKSSIPSSLKELFYRSTSKPIPSQPDEPTTVLSTKFIYGHELHV